MNLFFSFLFVLCMIFGLVACRPEDFSAEAESPSDTPCGTVGAPRPKLVAITDQRNDEVIVVDLAAVDITSEEAIVWRWRADMLGDVPHAALSHNRLDDVKLRYCEALGGYVVGITSSYGLISVVSYPEGKCLFSANGRGEQPHSIEILPNGLVAVACASVRGDFSQGKLRLYNAVSKTDPNFVQVPLESAHGVLWDPSEEVLWALGTKELNAYRVTGTRENPNLTLLQGKGASLPWGGHDLTPVYGNPDRLWISYFDVVQFSKSEGKLYTDYPANETINRCSVKSINSYADGTIVMSIADPNNGTAGHNTNKLTKYVRQEEMDGTFSLQPVEIPFASRDFYKVRVFDANYQ